jgi:hypothetical protein
MAITRLSAPLHRSPPIVTVVPVAKPAHRPCRTIPREKAEIRLAPLKINSHPLEKEPMGGRRAATAVREGSGRSEPEAG